MDDYRVITSGVRRVVCLASFAAARRLLCSDAPPYLCAVKVEVHSSSGSSGAGSGPGSGAGSEENLSSSDVSERSGGLHDYEDIYQVREQSKQIDQVSASNMFYRATLHFCCFEIPFLFVCGIR